MKVFEEITSLEHLFEIQRDFAEEEFGIKTHDDPMRFYYSLSGICQHAMEAIQYDRRWLPTVFNTSGCKYFQPRVKLRNIANAFRYLIDACLYSGITAEEFESTLVEKMIERIKRGDAVYEKFPFRIKTIEDIFALQTLIRKIYVPDVSLGDNPMYFYHSMNFIIEEVSEVRKEDSRSKEIILHSDGYKHNYNRQNKIEELGDVFREIINSCLYSDISANDLINTVISIENNSDINLFEIKS